MHLSARQIRHGLQILFLAVPGSTDESDPVGHWASRLIHKLTANQANLKKCTRRFELRNKAELVEIFVGELLIHLHHKDNNDCYKLFRLFHVKLYDLKCRN